MPIDKAKSTAGRIGAHEKWAKTLDRKSGTAAARKAALDRFERQVDPEGVLPEAQRVELAEHARKAHMLRMALRSAEVRRARRQTKAA
jgi:hypothetical protein